MEKSTALMVFNRKTEGYAMAILVYQVGNAIYYSEIFPKDI